MAELRYPESVASELRRTREKWFDGITKNRPLDMSWKRVFYGGPLIAPTA